MLKQWCRCWRMLTRRPRSRRATWGNSSPPTPALTWGSSKSGSKTGCSQSHPLIFIQNVSGGLKKSGWRRTQVGPDGASTSGECEATKDDRCWSQIPTFHLRGLKGPLSPGREKRAGKSQISFCPTLKMILTVIYEQGQIATGTVS